MRKYILIVSTIIFLSCNKKTDSNQIVHPTAENLNPKFGITQSIDKNDEKLTDYSKLNVIKNNILNRTILYTIGKLKGKSFEMLGEIQDAVLDINTNSLYVLDSQNIGINIYDDEGSYIKKVTREGKGPGELMNATSIKIKNDQAYVVNSHFDIKKYKRNNDGKFIYNEAIRTGYPPLDLCVGQDQLFIYSLSAIDGSSKINKDNIYAYMLNNLKEPVNSFGIQYKSDSWLPIFSMSAGAGIECSSHARMIVQYFQTLNLLYGYNNRGELQWITRLTDFNFLKLIERNGSMGPDRNNLQKNFDSIENVVAANNNSFIVQVMNKSFTDDGTVKQNSLSSYLIDFDSGKGIFIGNNLPVILSVKKDKIVSLVDRKYPKIEISAF